MSEGMIPVQDKQPVSFTHTEMEFLIQDAVAFVKHLHDSRPSRLTCLANWCVFIRKQEVMQSICYVGVSLDVNHALSHP